MRDYSQKLDNDTERLNNIQERLFNLDKLKRKYGGNLQSVLDTFEKLSQELGAIEFSTQNIDELEEKITTAEKQLHAMAQEISENRTNYAKVLSSLVQDKLEKLELPKARFEIAVRPKDLSADGRRYMSQGIKHQFTQQYHSENTAQASLYGHRNLQQ